MFEKWKDEIIDSILQLHEETKLIREYLEEENEEEETNTEKDEVEKEEQEEQEEEQEEQEEQEDQEEQDEQDVQEVQETIIIQKLDDINDSINNLTTTVVESSIVVSISIILALAFHYFVNQLSKW